MEDKNKKQGNKIFGDSPMQNDDLAIMPDNGNIGSSMEKSEAQADKGKVQKSSPEIKVAPKKKKGTFDMKLNALKQRKNIANAKKAVIKDEKKSFKLFSFSFKEPKSLLVELLKNSLVFLLSFGIFAFSLYLDSVISLASDNAFEDTFSIQIPQSQSISVEIAGSEVEIKNSYEIKGGEKIKTGASSPVIITLKNNGLLRIDKDTEIEIIDENNINLIKGKIWGNLLYNFFDLKINTEYLLIKPGVSSFEISSDELRTNIYSHKHNLVVDLLADGIAVNTLWIAEGNKASFLNTKIEQSGDKLDQLLYSKLKKEFNYGRQPSDELIEDDWLALNISEDDKYYVSIDAKFTREIRNEGLKNLSTDSIRFQTKEIIDDLRKTFTFSDRKKANTALNSIFENVHDAAYLYLQDEKVDAEVRLSLFKEDISDAELISSDIFKGLLDNMLVSTFNDYVYVIPSHKLYPVKQFLLEEYFKKNKEFDVLTLKINEVYDSIDFTSKDTNSLISEYFSWYEQLIRKNQSNLFEIQDEIIQQNILVDNLLLTNPEIYNLITFEAKRSMEDDYLATLPSSRDKSEQRQTFINEKINILARIQTYLFDDRLNPVDARQVVFKLITDIEDLKEDTLDIAAVNELFDRRLDDFGVFWEYLKSDEYSTTKLHGASHEERFNAFKGLQDKELSFDDIREEILGLQEDAEITADKILEEAQAELEEAEFQNVRFGTYVDTSKKIPILNADVNGIVFRATFDWERMLLSNIIIDDEIVTADGLKLNNARNLIIEWQARKTQATQIETEDEIEDEFEDIKNAARVFVVEKLKESDLVIEEENVRIKDLNGGKYEIQNVYFNNLKQAKFDFEYSTKDEDASNIVVHAADGDKLYEGPLALVFLDDIVSKIYSQES